jgi:hypothetical protein
MPTPSPSGHPTGTSSSVHTSFCHPGRFGFFCARGMGVILSPCLMKCRAAAVVSVELGLGLPFSLPGRVCMV